MAHLSQRTAGYDELRYHQRERTYKYFVGKPLFPFGHGLSYTAFRYSDLSLSSDSIKKTDLSRFASTSPIQAEERR
ncbi:hypothetical protein PO124_21345 [Bacillus licheniformis]|nr:hypothetical protein [Bacillus licheniformis]